MLDLKEEEVKVMYTEGEKFGCSRDLSLFKQREQGCREHTQIQHHAMPPKYHVGQRVSFRWELCTVRWIGTLKGRGEKVWIGVEWDNPTRGKNHGSLDGHQYFTCRSSNANTY
jgi:hypothetical protein